MKLSDFDYGLPEDLIAQYPLKKRDHARLLIVNRQKNKILHDQFSNLYQYLPSQSHLVLNNSKVVQARLFGNKESTGAKIEIFLLKQLEDGFSYEVLMRPMKRLKENDKIIFSKDVWAVIIDKDKRVVKFNKANIKSFLEKQGHIPLPPYIKRPDEKSDRTYYQTVYAKNLGSVAAPTAGLHFTKTQLAQLKKKGHTISYVTLHVNYGTFKPVEEEDIRDHTIHEEEYFVTQRDYKDIIASKKKGQPIVAVGTTGCRVIETLANTKKLEGSTNLFIYPGYNFQLTDCLITNFHLPRSTLLMLVCALGGLELIKKAYQEAIDKKYRFYSYGDAMIII